MAREMEQTVAMRAHLEVEKAKIRKSSIDCGRRPSRPLTSLYEVPEAEKFDEEKETEERKNIALIVPSGETSPGEKEKIEENLEGERNNGALGENLANSEVEKRIEELAETKIDEDEARRTLDKDEMKATENMKRESSNNEGNAEQLSSDEAVQYEPSGTSELTNPHDQATDSREVAAEQVSESHEDHPEIVNDISANASSGTECVESEAELAETDKKRSESLGVADCDQTAGETKENAMFSPDKELQVELINGGPSVHENLAGVGARVPGSPKLPEASSEDSPHEKQDNARDLSQPESQQDSQIRDDET